MTEIYDWRSAIVPADQLFVAGGRSIAGGMTVGGIRIESPSPGGRGELHMSFSTLNRSLGASVSWTISRIRNGAIMRVPLCGSPQIVPDTALGLSGGLTWSNGKKWSSGVFWLSRPNAPVAASAAKGTTVLSVDLSTYGQVVEIGHVIGVSAGGFEFAHLVEDISYDSANTATMTISPPLRRAVTTSDTLQFRPTMLCVCRNPEQVAQPFVQRRVPQLGAAEFVEALV